MPGFPALMAAAMLCACGAPLPEPPAVRAVHGVATVELTAQIDPLSGMPVFVYRGRRGVVPTVRVDPGDQIVVDVANDLPMQGGRGSDLNLHFHGLSVSPNPPADDVLTTLALPGHTLHYVVPIPKSQEPGLYWYHPHVFPARACRRSCARCVTIPAPAALRPVASSPGGAAYGFPLPPVAAQRTVVFSEDSNGMYVNGKQFSMDAGPMFVVRVGTVERWQIVNVTQEVHDFHIHQVHFFVQQVNGVAVRHPHWEDTVVVPARIPVKNGSWKPGYVTLLIDFRDPVIAGEFMVHCHILDHEDAGMMAKIRAI